MELPELEFHPAANALPMMQDEKIQALKIDLLKTEKLVNPIWLKDGMILDGRARYTIIRELKADNLLTFVPDIREWTNETDPNEMVMSFNIIRSNYKAQQRAMYAAKYILPELKIEAIQRKLAGRKCEVTGSSAKIAARLAATNDRYITWAGATLAHDEKFYDLVMDGKIDLRESYAMVQSDTNPEFYTYIIDAMLSGKTYEQANNKYQSDQQRTLDDDFRKTKENRNTQSPVLTVLPNNSTVNPFNTSITTTINPSKEITDELSEETDEAPEEETREINAANYRPAIMFALNIRPTTMNKIVALLEHDLIIAEPISIWHGTSISEELLKANNFRAIKNINSKLPTSNVIISETEIAA